MKNKKEEKQESSEGKIDIDALLKSYKEDTQKILDLLDEKVVNLEDEETGQEKHLEDAEVDERASESEMFWRKHYKKRIKLKTYQTIREIAQKVETPVQAAFFRGILFAYQEEADWFKQQAGISQQNRQKQKQSQGGITPVGELKVD